MYAERRAPCPDCKTSFADMPPNAVGEKAVTRAQDDWARPQGKRRRSGANGHANGNDDDDDDEEDELEAEEGASQEPSASLEQRAVQNDENLPSENEYSQPVRQPLPTLLMLVTITVPTSPWRDDNTRFVHRPRGGRRHASPTITPSPQSLLGPRGRTRLYHIEKCLRQRYACQYYNWRPASGVIYMPRTMMWSEMGLG